MTLNELAAKLIRKLQVSSFPRRVSLAFGRCEDDGSRRLEVHVLETPRDEKVQTVREVARVLIQCQPPEDDLLDTVVFTHEGCNPVLRTGRPVGVFEPQRTWLIALDGIPVNELFRETRNQSWEWGRNPLDVLIGAIPDVDALRLHLAFQMADTIAKPDVLLQLWTTTSVLERPVCAMVTADEPAVEVQLDDGWAPAGNYALAA